MSDILTIGSFEYVPLASGYRDSADRAIAQVHLLGISDGAKVVPAGPASPVPVTIITGAATAAITVQKTDTPAGSKVLKTSAGTFVYCSVAGNTADCFLTLVDAATLPNDGAIVPFDTVFCPAGRGGYLDWSDHPAAFGTGLIVFLSSAGSPFTKTEGPAGFIKAAFF